MNYKFIYSVLIIGIMFLYTACTDQGSVVRNYKIVNGTSFPVTLRFFSVTNQSTPVFVREESRVGLGVVYETTLETFNPNAGGFNVPVRAYMSDSIALFLNNERLKGHRIDNPLGKSLLSLGDYNNEGNNYTYTITQENFDNAILCDGPCK